MRLWETMYKKVIKKTKLHFAPQGGDHYNISKEEKCFIQDKKDLFASVPQQQWEGVARWNKGTSDQSDLSSLPAPVLDSVPEASGYFCKGGLSGCSNHLLFTLLMREGSCTLNYTRWLNT